MRYLGKYPPVSHHLAVVYNVFSVRFMDPLRREARDLSFSCIIEIFFARGLEDNITYLGKYPPVSHDPVVVYNVFSVRFIDPLRREAHDLSFFRIVEIFSGRGAGGQYNISP